LLGAGLGGRDVLHWMVEQLLLIQGRPLWPCAGALLAAHQRGLGPAPLHRSLSHTAAQHRQHRQQQQQQQHRRRQQHRQRIAVRGPEPLGRFGRGNSDCPRTAVLTPQIFGPGLTRKARVAVTAGQTRVPGECNKTSVPRLEPRLGDPASASPKGLSPPWCCHGRFLRHGATSSESVAELARMCPGRGWKSRVRHVLPQGSLSVWSDCPKESPRPPVLPWAQDANGDHCMSTTAYA
jgi:hypothetical protein